MCIDLLVRVASMLVDAGPVVVVPRKTLCHAGAGCGRQRAYCAGSSARRILEEDAGLVPSL
jgi:hypothetical protein